MAYYKCGSIYTTQNSNVVVDTASGAIANFQTSLALPLLKTRFDFKATQDLHGQSGPYPAGGSAQKWDEETINGYLSSTDGSFISHNTSICSKNFNTIEPSTDYFLFKGSSTPATYVCLYDANYDFIKREAVAGVKVTTPSNAAYFKISCYGYGATYKNDISINYPATDTAYHPYSNICPISGVSEINVTKCGLNLADIKPIEDWDLSGAYYLLFNSVPNKQVQMCFIDNDTSVDVSDINIGFVDSNYDKVHALTPQQYRWCLTSGGIQTNRTNLSVQGNNILTGLIIYPKSEEVFNRLFARYKIVLSINNETTYESYNGSTTIINLGGTYYGGYVTQDKDGKRELVVTHGILDLSTIEWLVHNQGFYYKTISDDLNLARCQPTVIPEFLATKYQVKTGQYIYAHATEYGLIGQNSNQIYITDATNPSGNLVYPLAEPFTIALPDGTPIKSLPGVNNIYADTGDTSLQFRKIG